MRRKITLNNPGIWGMSVKDTVMGADGTDFIHHGLQRRRP